MPISRTRTRTLVAAVLAVASIVMPGLPSASAKPKTYVALGDSFAAGPLIPMQEQPWGCLRSTNNYPKLLASRRGLALVDATCSGATTKHMTREQGVSPEPNPPQLDRLAADTALVSLQIGGNDIGFSGIARSCIEAAFAQTSCRASFTDPETGEDVLQGRIAGTAPKIAAVLEGIRARSTDAEIVVLGYPAIFRIGPGPASCPAMGVGEEDARYLRGIQESLNAMIEATAVANGATYVDVYGPSAGRTACDLPLLRWVEPLVPVHAAAPIHPNLNGMLGMSDAVEVAIWKQVEGSDLELPPGTPSLPPVTSPY